VGYIDLIPDVFRLTMPDLATGRGTCRCVLSKESVV